MKIGAELVDAILPMAGLLSQSLDQHSQFYQFLESNPQHKTFLQILTGEMQFALRFRGPGSLIDKNGLTKNLFGEYLEAIIELNASNPTRLNELFQHPIAKSIVWVFRNYLSELTALNDEFVAFQRNLQAPSMPVAETSSHASTSAPIQEMVDLIAYRKWQESEDMKQTAKRAQTEKPSSSDKVDSDARSKRQRRN